MDKCLESIIGGVFGLAGVIVGFLLQLWSNSITERKQIKAEFAEIKNAIYHITVVNDLCPALLKLREFFIRNDKYLKNKVNKSFFDKWLTEPEVEEGFTGVGYWTKEKVKEMHDDLNRTKL